MRTPDHTLITISWEPRVRFARGVFAAPSDAMRLALGPTARGVARAKVFLDAGLAAARPDLAGEIDAYARVNTDWLELASDVVLVPGGETAKNGHEVLERLLTAMAEAHLCRRSYAVAIGGGAVLDVVGLAAALTHRGVRLVRLPSTTLAQGDSGVAVKNGINAFGKKNFLGTFAPPWAVINDFTLLRTLGERDWRCGFSEAVKVALIKDRWLFEQIESAATAIGARDERASESIIRRSAELHLAHISRGGDPFELDRARPLDFGHWAAHRLESMSGYTLRHGEAVAIGVAIDSAYSALCGWLSFDDAARVAACLRSLGFDLTHDELARVDDVLGGLDQFREHLGGELAVPMLNAIGSSFDVDEIDEPRMRRAIEMVAGGEIGGAGVDRTRACA